MDYSRTTVIGFAAFTVGGAIGFFAAKHLLEQHYREIAQMEIDEVREYYKEKYDDPRYQAIADKYKKPDLFELAPSENDIYDEEEDEDYEDYEDEPDDYEEEFYEEEEEDPMDYEIDPDRDPYAITYEQFVAPYPEFRKVDLFYYRLDDVVCDGNDMVLPEPEDELGWDWMRALETQTAAFIRNDKTQTDFAIHAFARSYETDVKVKQETDRERNFRRTARQKEAMDASSDEFLAREKEMATNPKRRKPYNRPSKQELEEIVEESVNDHPDYI